MNTKGKSLSELKELKIQEVHEALIEYNKQFYDFAKTSGFDVKFEGDLVCLYGLKRQILMTTRFDVADLKTLAFDRVNEQFKWKKDYTKEPAYFLNELESSHKAKQYIENKSTLDRLYEESRDLSSQISDLEDDLEGVLSSIEYFSELINE